MTFDAIGFGGLAEGGVFPLFSVVTDSAVFILSVGFLGYFQVFLLHLKDFRMTIRAFHFFCGYVIGMTEKHRGCPFGLIGDISAPHLFLPLSLGIRQPDDRKNQKDDKNTKVNQFFIHGFLPLSEIVNWQPEKT